MRSDWGGLGLREDDFDVQSFKDFYDRCALRGYYFSLLDASDAFGADLLDTIQALTGCVMFIDPASEQIVIKEYYWTNFDVSTAMLLNEDNILDLQEMPRTGWNSMPTHFEMRWTDRESNYQPKTLRRISRSIDSDDKREGYRLSSRNATICCSKAVVKKCLTRLIMHNGAPTQQLTVTVNSDALSLTPGSTVKLTYDRYDLEEAGFWVTTVKSTDVMLNQYLVTGYYYTRPDSDDFDDEEDTSDWVAPVIRPVAPTEYEFVSFGILANVLRRLNINKPYATGKTFNSYGLLFVRPDNEGQVSVNVFTRQGALVRKNVLYSGSARFVGNMDQNYKATEGYIPSLTLTDAAGLSILAGSRLAYANGEWFSFDGVQFAGTDVTLTGVLRGLWGSPTLAHTAGDNIWFMDDSGSRLFRP
jgi:hypothetical protein